MCGHRKNWIAVCALKYSINTAQSRWGQICDLALTHRHLCANDLACFYTFCLVCGSVGGHTNRNCIFCVVLFRMKGLQDIIVPLLQYSHTITTTCLFKNNRTGSGKSTPTHLNHYLLHACQEQWGQLQLHCTIQLYAR